jgi:hypothetical protein
MNDWRRYKGVLCHPGSELEKLLASGKADDLKKAQDLYQKITNDGVARGEFVSRGRTDSKCNYLAIGSCNKCGRHHNGNEV